MLLRRSTLAVAAVLALAATALHADPTAAADAAAARAAAAAPANTEPDDPLASERALFKRPAILKGNIAFWRKVFSEYSKHQSVVHDIRRPERVYQVLDFRDSVPVVGNQINSLKNSEEESAKRRIAELLRETAALVDNPDAMSNDQRRLAALFADDAAALLNAADYIRVQRGLREQTAEAMKISGQYLPEMERIFADEGLPRLLTRLPFVESSFNVEAYSKVAAAGLWQFMPSSAKLYMRYNNIADDRKDPWRSTRAAAAHLKDDYRVLRDWPLAVTAYNYGRGGLVKGLNEIGGTSLADLIERYDGKRFGFASRNFYSEFIAATDVERDWREHFEGVERRPQMRFDEVRLPRYTPWNTLVRLSGGDEAAFRKLNPAYRDQVTSGRLYVPAGDVIRVPDGAGDAFMASYANLGSGQTFARQRDQFVVVKVRKGETLGAIAARFGVSESSLRSLNRIKKGRVRAGMRLRVPNDGENDLNEIAQAEPEPVEAPKAASGKQGSKEVAAEIIQARTPSCEKLKGQRRKACLQEAESEAAANEVARNTSGSKAGKAKAPKEPALRTHKVKEGQNLTTIARRYDTTVKALMELNGLGKGNNIRPGMKLKVPAA